jgi:phosphoenolpyruvate-protein kinase (PTS system EI component)
LTEDEQYSYYKEILEIMDGKPVTFRLMDIGGDKKLSFLDNLKNVNQTPGLRGARFLLINKELLTTQLRALLKLSLNYNIKILFPMVIDAYQMSNLMQIANETMDKTDHNSENIEFGAMFETPSSFLDAEAIMELCDFGSIGSNDLIQYLFALDRNDEIVSLEYNPKHPILLKLLEELSTKFKKIQKPLSICGEIAGHPGVTELLISMGIHFISVNPRLIPEIKKRAIIHLKN